MHDVTIIYTKVAVYSGQRHPITSLLGRFHMAGSKLLKQRKPAQIMKEKTY